jgi:aquaglyceroporin related protein
MVFREYAAEFLGVMILVIFGNGVDCQVVLSTNAGVASSPKGVCAVEFMSKFLSELH